MRFYWPILSVALVLVTYVTNLHAQEAKLPAVKASSESNSKSNRVMALGLYLGSDTVEDVKGKSDGQRFDYKDDSGLYVKGRVVSTESVDGLTRGVFRIDGTRLFGTFYNGKLMEIAVVNRSWERLVNWDDGSSDELVLPSLIREFNKKYKPQKTEATRTDRGGLLETTSHYTWKERGDNFTIQLDVVRYKVTNVVQCLAITSILSGRSKAERENRCNPKADHLYDYSLSYRDDKLWLPLVSELLRYEKEKKSVQRKGENDSLKKF